MVNFFFIVFLCFIIIIIFLGLNFSFWFGFYFKRIIIWRNYRTLIDVFCSFFLIYFYGFIICEWSLLRFLVMLVIWCLFVYIAREDLLVHSVFVCVCVCSSSTSFSPWEQIENKNKNFCITISSWTDLVTFTRCVCGPPSCLSFLIILFYSFFCFLIVFFSSMCVFISGCFSYCCSFFLIALC